MTSRLRVALSALAAFIDEKALAWRYGTRRGQFFAMAVLALISVGIMVASLMSYNLFPVATYVLPLLLGSITLRYQPLLLFVGLVAACAAVTVTRETIVNGWLAPRMSNIIMLVLVAVIVLFAASRYRSGLPGQMGEAMLVDLNERLQVQGIVPTLPNGWQSQSAMLSAGGAKFAGDFLVANLSDDQSQLEMVLVDVCGKGVGAGTQSLQFAGALGGLIGSLPPLGLFSAANDFLLRQRWDEGFATAVHVLVDLDSGAFSVINAGHPPALRWSDRQSLWNVDGARGTALGVLDRPDFVRSTGVIEPGDALMFYTDGVVESRVRDVRSGIDWLRGIAGRVILADGFEDAPRRILAHVTGGDDDRAVLVLSRERPVVDYSRGR
ncbi:MAG: PP2C family protein-serine/threonine phosphatase [Aeromicrobium sp.]